MTDEPRMAREVFLNTLFADMNRFGFTPSNDELRDLHKWLDDPLSKYVDPLMDRFEDHKRHSSVRRALVGAVLEGMRKAQYEPPAETVDLFSRWVSDEVSVSVYEMDAVLRPFMEWKKGHPTERKVDRVLDLSDEEIEAIRKSGVDTDRPYNLDDSPDD